MKRIAPAAKPNDKTGRVSVCAISFPETIQSCLVLDKMCFFLVWGLRENGVYCIKVDCNYNDFLFFMQALEFQYPQVSFPRIFLHRSMQQMLVEFNNLQVTNPSMKSSKGSNAHDDGGIVQ